MNDFNKLRLKHHGSPEKLWEILQAECRYKTAKKLPKTLNNPDFIFPSLSVAEMATSDAVAEVHASMITEGTTVLDMTCGLGIDTFHLANKASQVTAIEIDNDSYKAAVHNTKSGGYNNVMIINDDSVAWLNRNENIFDVIFIDPARRDSSGRHYALKDCQPDITTALPLLLQRCGKLIIKCSPMLSIDAAQKELGVESDVTIIGTPKECKEVVFTINGEHPQIGTLPRNHHKVIKCVTIDSCDFTFTNEEEKNASVKFGLPQISGYIYEPYPAVMKGGGYRILSQRFNINKLHPSTHLYFSPTPIADFPGERFKIIEIIPFSKQSCKEFANRYDKINVATRNFPLSAPDLVKKLRVKEGGDKMVFGAINSTDEKILIVTEMGIKS